MLAGLFLIAGLATLGLPGLSQFVSEILVLIAAFDYHWWVGAIAVTGIVLAAVYMLWLYQRTMTGPGVTGDEPSPTSTGARWARSCPLMLALVLFGFYPMPLLDVINPRDDHAARARRGAGSGRRRSPAPRRRLNDH